MMVVLTRTLLLLMTVAGLGLAAQDLSVFLPEAPSNLKLRAALERDASAGAYVITVHSKHRSLGSLLSRKKPDVILAPYCFGIQQPDYVPVLQCVDNDVIARPWAIVSLQKGIDDDALAKAVLGSLDLGGRTAVNDIVRESFGDDLRFRRIRLASRPEDVVTMLGLELADVCLLDHRQLATARERFGDDLAIIRTGRDLPLARIFLRQGSAADATKLGNMTPQTLQTMGYTGLEPIVATDKPDPQPEGDE